MGTSTAALYAGGKHPAKTEVESWDGSSWTEIADINTARGYSAGIGIQTAALVVCGSEGGANEEVEEWDGSSWTEIAAVNSDRKDFLGQAGTSSLGLIYGGHKPGTGVFNATEVWDATSWTEVANLSTARTAGGGSPAGTTSLALGAGGNSPGGDHANTEEWTHAIAAVTFTSS